MHTPPFLTARYFRLHHGYSLVCLLMAAVFLFTSASAANTPVLSPTAPPDGLQAKSLDGQVKLSWNAVPGAVSYQVYRSTLSGQDYHPMGTIPGDAVLTSFSYTDSGVINQIPYYYVVTAISSAGTTSGFSAEASAMPNYEILSATVDPTGDYQQGSLPGAPILFKAQYSIDQRTGINGPAREVSYQVGFGSLDVPPAQWTHWVDARYLSRSLGDILYDYVQAAVNPAGFETGNTYYYVFRFSTHHQFEWVYASRSGIIINPDQTQTTFTGLGTLNVLNRTSTTLPGQPTGLWISRIATTFLSLSWNPPVFSDGGIKGFDIYRADTPIGAPILIDRVKGSSNTFTDIGLAAGRTYYYGIQTVDIHDNISPLTTPLIEATTLDSPKNVTINLTVPPFTPGGVYINPISAENPLTFGEDWQAHPMQWDAAAQQWTANLTLQEGQLFTFRFSRGSQDTLQTLEDGINILPDPSFRVNRDLIQTVNRVVYNWHDPLVIGHQPAAGAVGVHSNGPIRVTWNQNMPSTTSFTVEELSETGGKITYTSVLGSFQADALAHSILFSPSWPLKAHTTYRVTVDHSPDPGGTEMKAPVQWSFTTGDNRIYLPFLAK